MDTWLKRTLIAVAVLAVAWVLLFLLTLDNSHHHHHKASAISTAIKGG